MILFSKKKDRRMKDRQRLQKIDVSVLSRVVAFAENVVPLSGYSAFRVKLITSAAKKYADGIANCEPYYLLIFAGEEDRKYLNGGYAAGQTAAFLRFLGLQARVMASVPGWMRDEQKGERCVAAVAFGQTIPDKHHKHKEENHELPCICREFSDHWDEEVLELAKEKYPLHLANIRIVRENHCICLMQKSLVGKKTQIAEFEAGVAAAQLMAAAEELWIDLTTINLGEPRCLVSLCRKRDLTDLEKAKRKGMIEQMPPVLKAL